MSRTLKRKRYTFSGIIITVIATLLFLWAAVQWFSLSNWPPRLSPGNIQTNELKSYKNLQNISDAQEKYRELEWDAGAEKTYAGYFIHLWTSINRISDPVLINLIPKKLAFAMGASRAVNGYYFIDLHTLIAPATGEVEWLDHRRYWEIIGAPSTMNRSGRLIFLADQSGSIYVKDMRIHPKNYIDNPLSDGWTRIESIQDLKKFQKEIDYTL